jgi:hypothetical protein
MHYSQTHDYGGAFDATFLGGAGPYEYLLRDEINDLCLSCHDGGSFVPYVLGLSSASDIREAGYLNRVGVGDEESGHTLDTTAAPPGGTWTPDPGHGLVCTDCHHQHGYGGPATDPNGQYRNLQYAPGTGFSFGNPALVTYAITTVDLNKDVFERAAASYDEADVDFCEPDPTDSAIARWCSGCHEQFHGLADGSDPDIGGVEIGSSGIFDEFVRHPVGGVDIGAASGAGSGGHSSLATYAGRTSRVKVMDPTGTWDATSLNLTPTCISCHKAHGNGNKFGLIFRGPDAVLPPTEEGGAGGSQYENLCANCHVQASAF